MGPEVRKILERWSAAYFQIIFTTSYDQYVLKAIRFRAIDYFLKPPDSEELQRAAPKVLQRSQKPIAQQLEILETTPAFYSHQ